MDYRRRGQRASGLYFNQTAMSLQQVDGGTGSETRDGIHTALAY